MKSFFKKLAFVMAMAMVVSLAAPAAASAASDVILCYQDKTEEVLVHPMTIGDTQDFWFKNAKNWEHNCKWETENPAIATVDNKGLVTAVAEGDTNLNFLIGGEVVATTQIVVTKPSTKDQFEVTQTSYKELTLKFAEDTEIKSGDVKLFLMLPNEEKPEEPIEVPWPVATSKNVDKKTITIQPTVEPGNGDVIKVVAGSYEDEVTTVVAKPDTVVISYKDTKDGDVTVDKKISVVAKLYANGGKIDVTDKYYDKYTVKFAETLVDTDKFDKNDYVCEYDAANDYVFNAYLFEVGLQLTVKATLYDEKNQEVTSSNTLAFNCVETKDWEFDGKVKDWAIVKNTDTFVVWSNKSIPADASPAGDYSIVLKFEDNNGDTYVTHKAAEQENKNEGDKENIYMDGTDAISTHKYEVNFYSTNPDLMLVDEATGALGVYTPAKVTFYVGLVYDNKVDAPKYIYAREVEITEATKLDDVTIKDNKKSITILTKAIDSAFLSSEEIIMEAWDQYDKAWNKVEYKAYYLNNKNEEVKVGTIDGSKITFTSGDFAGLTGTVNVTIKGTTTDILGNKEFDTATLFVNLTTPNTNSDGTIKLDQVSATRYKTYDAVLVGAPEIDVNAISKTGYITLYKTSNSAKVDTYTEKDGFVAVTDKDHLAELAAGKEGTKYVVLKDVDGNVVPLSWTPSGDKLQYTLNELNKVNGVTGSELEYAPTGAYTVEAVIVRYNERNAKIQDNYVSSATLNVKNTATKVELDGWHTKVYSGEKCYDVEATYDEDNNVIPKYTLDVEKVILATLKFKNATITAENIIDYKAVVLGSNVITQYVSLRVYLDDAKTAYYEVTLKPELIAVKSDNTWPELETEE